MELTLGQVLKANQAAAKLTGMDLPVVLAYRVLRALKAIAPEVEGFEQSQNALVMRYGELTPEGQQVRPDMATWPDFAREANALTAEAVEVAVRPVRLALLIEAGVKLNASEVSAMDGVILEGVEEALDALDQAEPAPLQEA